MKKLLLCLFFVFVLAMPVMADETITVDPDKAFNEWTLVKIQKGDPYKVVLSGYEDCTWKPINTEYLIITEDGTMTGLEGGAVVVMAKTSIIDSKGDSHEVKLKVWVEGEKGKVVPEKVKITKKKKETSEIPSSWEKTYYVDEFGDPTDDEMYLKCVEGTFSNTATTDSECTIACVLDLNKQSFRFHIQEYNKYEALFDRDSYIKAKCDDEIIAEAFLDRSDSGKYAFLEKPDYFDLVREVKAGKSIKVAIVSGNSKYIFEL